jgi:hypothetical protein
MSTERKNLAESFTLIDFPISNPSRASPACYSEVMSSTTKSTKPADDGFVFSNDEIETFLRREERRQQANIHDFEAHA